MMVIGFLIGGALLIALAYIFRHRVVRVVEWPVFQLAHYFLYRDSEAWDKTHWLGVPLLKLPNDLWTYQQIIWETKPTLIIETGTNKGGSAKFFADLLGLIGNGGRVVTVDIARAPEGVPDHPQVTYLIGSSTDPKIVAEVKSHVRPDDTVMVILDSDHSANHVSGELNEYAGLVTPGCYLVVEDTNVNGHPVSRSHGPGPMEAIEGFLPKNPDFVSDYSREVFKVTFYPNGWIKRIAPKQKPVISGNELVQSKRE